MSADTIKAVFLQTRRYLFMSQLSEKELSTIKDLLSEEDLLVKKFQMLAQQAQTEELKCKMMDISKKHQGHFNELYSKLS